MKKQIKISLTFIALGAMLALSSFKPLEKKQVIKLEGTKNVNSVNIETYDFRLRTANNMLVFPSAESYYKAVNNPEEAIKNSLIDQVARQTDFTRIEEATSLYNLIEDDYFRALLNNNGCIQIGNNIYKISPEKESVFVLTSNRIGSLNDLINENIANSDILQYAIEDDVIGMVESNTPPSNAKLFCNESGCGSDEKSGHLNLLNPNNGAECNWMDSWVMYKRYGVYFTLKAKCKNRCPSRRMYWHKTPVAYKVKCGSTYYAQYQWDQDSGGNGSNSWDWNHHFYQGVQPLNGFWLRVVFMAKDAGWIGNPDNPSSDLEIRKNM